MIYQIITFKNEVSMKASEVTPDVIGKKVSCIENGYRVTGTIIGIVDTEYEIGVRIKFDKPLTCWSGDFEESWVETEYDSTKAKQGLRDNLQFTLFIEEELPEEWLKTYKPAERHITRWPEYKEIAKQLKLYDSTKEHVCKMRDKVVEFYDKLMDDAIEKGERQKCYDYAEAMMSVTAVIDDFKWKMGVEV